MNKKIIAVTFATGIVVQATCSIIPDSEISNAAIIQPKLCYSDIWVTDYEVIGTGRLESISGKYPYLEHRLDVYTDGTAKYYEYNNHEWDSYSYDPDCTVRFDGYGDSRIVWYPQTEISTYLGSEVPDSLAKYYEEREAHNYENEVIGIYMSLITPTPDDYFDTYDTLSDDELSKMYSWHNYEYGRTVTFTFNQPKRYRTTMSNLTFDTINDWVLSKPHYYPYYKNSNASYNIINNLRSETRTDYLVRDCIKTDVYADGKTQQTDYGFEIGCLTGYGYAWTGKLANLPFINNQVYPHYGLSCVQYCEFTPKADFSHGMLFSFGDHSIEVPASAFTSEEPVINQESLEDRVIALEKENQELRASSSANNVKLDNHTAGYITASDAQDVLRYYCESIVGNESGKVEDYNSFVMRGE